MSARDEIGEMMKMWITTGRCPTCVRYSRREITLPNLGVISPTLSKPHRIFLSQYFFLEVMTHDLCSPALKKVVGVGGKGLLDSSGIGLRIYDSQFVHFT